MAMLLSQQYLIRRERVSCLSNAAFLPISGNSAARQTLKTVSFLSNITFEKGIATFVELANELHARGVPVRCRIAGPAAPEVREWLDDVLAKAPHIEYLGAQYGTDKNRFLDQTDLLVFPSVYANEAQPVTILEAFSFGIPAIATDLGCIPGLIADERGFVLATQACTATAIADLISHLTKDQPAYQRLSANCNAYVEKSSTVHTAALTEIVGAIQRGRDFGARL
jgi:glycosyltransferase involved in cell wall biosynthesis